MVKWEKTLERRVQQLADQHREYQEQIGQLEELPTVGRMGMEIHCLNKGKSALWADNSESDTARINDNRCDIGGFSNLPFTARNSAWTSIICMERSMSNQIHNSISDPHGWNLRRMSRNPYEHVSTDSQSLSTDSDPATFADPTLSNSTPRICHNVCLDLI
jgi:hypothetical protein